MKEQDGYYIWDKEDENEALSKHFDTKEFSCLCKYESCKEQKISKSLISKLELVRDEVDSPLRITSGFRCAEHQEYLRGAGVSTVVAKKSTHEKGDAADVQIVSDKADKMDTLLGALEKEFKAIGLAKTFYHVDLRDDKKRRWNY